MATESNKGCENNSKHETIEISDESSNPRCRSQVWNHFGYKVTYSNNGLRSKSSTEVICKLCQGEFKYIGTTTNMATHLSRHHSIENKRQRTIKTDDREVCRPNGCILLSVRHMI